MHLNHRRPFLFLVALRDAPVQFPQSSFAKRTLDVPVSRFYCFKRFHRVTREQAFAFKHYFHRRDSSHFAVNIDSFLLLLICLLLLLRLVHGTFQHHLQPFHLLRVLRELSFRRPQRRRRRRHFFLLHLFLLCLLRRKGAVSFIADLVLVLVLFLVKSTKSG